MHSCPIGLMQDSLGYSKSVLTCLFLVQGEVKVIISLDDIPYPTIDHLLVLRCALGFDSSGLSSDRLNLVLMGFDFSNKGLQHNRELKYLAQRGLINHETG